MLLKFLKSNTSEPQFEFINVADTHPVCGQHWNGSNRSWRRPDLFLLSLFVADMEQRERPLIVRLCNVAYFPSILVVSVLVS
jgi:hypothetical protein